MSNRNKFRAVLSMVSKLTPELVSKDVRGTLQDMKNPINANVTCIQDATVAEIQAQFPDWETNPIVLENLISGYCGRLLRMACLQNDLNPMELSLEQLTRLTETTERVEAAALRRMTMN